MKVKNSESFDGIGSLILSVITEDIFAGISMEKNQTLTPFRSDLETSDALLQFNTPTTFLVLPQG